MWLEQQRLAWWRCSASNSVASRHSNCKRRHHAWTCMCDVRGWLKRWLGLPHHTCRLGHYAWVPCRWLPLPASAGTAVRYQQVVHAAALNCLNRTVYDVLGQGGTDARQAPLTKPASTRWLRPRHGSPCRQLRGWNQAPKHGAAGAQGAAGAGRLDSEPAPLFTRNAGSAVAHRTQAYENMPSGRKAERGEIKLLQRDTEVPSQRPTHHT